MRDRICGIICTSGFLGRIRPFPGTAGTMGGVAIFLGLVAAGADRPAAVLGLCFLVAAIGIGLTPWARRAYGRVDPPEVVIDEVAGYLLTVAVFIRSLPAWAVAAAGFVLFRLFDIVKPPPVGWIDRSSSRYALVGDDLAAGALASVCLHAIALAVGGRSA